MALVDSRTVDIARIEWTEERLLRAAYLIELERAVRVLDPKNGVARWIATPNPGPFSVAIHHCRYRLGVSAK
jgi:hypothetical protein